jgi:anti-sigma regulatory factor (Ser/Thr protein kinase)
MASTLSRPAVLAPDLTAPQTAREHARQACADITSQALADDVALVVSELVTNAMTHGAGEISLVLRVEPSEVRVSVWDQGLSFVAQPVEAEHAAEHSRGLALVGELASSWGVDGLAGAGKSVWAVVGAPVRGFEAA